jgi:hypothetical protein
MSMNGSGSQTITPRCTSRPGVFAAHRGTWFEPTSKRFVVVAAVGVGLVSFLATELMHYLLVPDLGRHHERLLAEGLSAVVVTCLIAKLANITRQQRRLTMARMQVIAEMNHHIRNALTPVSLSVDAIDNQQLTCVISEAVNRIEWALREILPRETPLQEEHRQEFGHFETGRSEHR